MEAGHSRSIAAIESGHSSGHSSGESSPLVPPASSPQLTPSPQLKPVEYKYPLSQLNKLLRRLWQAAEELKENVKAAYKAGPWPWQTPTEEQVALATLLKQIDPKEDLTTQLADCIDAINAFHKNCYQKWEDGFARADKKNATAIKTCATNTFKALKSQFDDDCKQYAGLLDALAQYRQQVKGAKLQYICINEDAGKAKEWIEQINKDRAELDVVAELKKVGLDRPPALSEVTEMLEETSDDLVYKQLCLEVDALLRQVTTLTNERIDEQPIVQRRQELDRHAALYAEAEKEYDVLRGLYAGDVGSSDLRVETGRISRDVHAKLEEFNKSEALNQDEIIKILERYLDSDPTVVDGGVKRSVLDLLRRRAEQAVTFQGQLNNLKSQAGQQLAAVLRARDSLVKLDEKYKALSLPKEGGFAWVNHSSPDQQAKIIKEFRAKFGDDLVKSMLQDFESQLKKVLEKERELLAAIDKLQQNDSKNQNEIAELQRLMLVDQRACKIDNCEEYFLGLQQDVQQRIKIITEAAKHFLSIETAMKIRLAEYHDGNGFASNASKESMQRAEKELIALNKAKTALSDKLIEQLSDTHDKWRKKANNLDELDAPLQALQLASGVEQGEKEFYVALRSLITSLLKINVIAIDGNDKLVDSYKTFARRLARVLSQMREQIVPEIFLTTRDSVKDAEKLLYSQVKLHVEGTLVEKSGTRRNEEMERAKASFLDYYKRVDWCLEKMCTVDEFNADIAYPEQLRQQIEALAAYESQLVDGSFVEELEKNIHLIENGLGGFVQYKHSLSILEHNIAFFLKRHGFYKSAHHAITTKLALLQEQGPRVKEMIEVLSRLKEQAVRCANAIQSMVDDFNSINAYRAELSKVLNALERDLGDDVRQLTAALSKIQAEAQFKTNVEALYQGITDARQGKASINPSHGELFERLKRQFLFGGRSAELIAELRVHWQQKHAQTRKGQLIGLFLDGLFDANKATDLTALSHYLQQPFDEEDDNRALFENTGASNFCGVGADSTTKKKIAELSRELMRLVGQQTRIEGQFQAGSIAYGLEQDYEQMMREYRDLLKQKKVAEAAPSVQTAEDCEALVAHWVTKQRPVDNVTMKIQQDLVAMQSWVGKDRSNIACRYARMQCVIAIRQNDPQRQALYQQYKFSYTYEALKCHLENVVTKREREKSILWRNLDRIAFGSGSEDEKYTRMQQSIHQFYDGLRRMKHGSAGYFFGKGSRLADGLERFLTQPETVDGGLGFQPNQVVHAYHEEGCFNAIAQHVSEKLFSR